MYKNLIVEVHENIATVTVNRPEVRNALNADSWHELDELVSELEKQDRIRVVILRGAGDKAFVAGADLNALRERSMIETFRGENQAILNRWAEMNKITIAAINGFALGGGCELALACDLRIASKNSKLGQPELNLGFLPGAGGTQRLVRLIGLGKAKELILTGDIIDAEEALRIGLVNQVVESHELINKAQEMAQKILAKAPLAVTFAKMVLNLGESTDIHSGLALEKLAQTVLFSTDDHLEGIAAFFEKRSPKYTGK